MLWSGYKKVNGEQCLPHVFNIDIHCSTHTNVIDCRSSCCSACVCYFYLLLAFGGFCKSVPSCLSLCSYWDCNSWEVIERTDSPSDRLSMQMECSMKVDHPECRITPRKQPRHVPEILPCSWKSHENIVRIFYNFRTQQTNWTIASNCMFSIGITQDLGQQVDRDTGEEARQFAQITWQVSSKRSDKMRHFCKLSDKMRVIDTEE